MSQIIDSLENSYKISEILILNSEHRCMYYGICDLSFLTLVNLKHFKPILRMEDRSICHQKQEKLFPEVDAGCCQTAAYSCLILHPSYFIVKHNNYVELSARWTFAGDLVESWAIQRKQFSNFRRAYFIEGRIMRFVEPRNWE